MLQFDIDLLSKEAIIEIYKLNNHGDEGVDWDEVT